MKVAILAGGLGTRLQEETTVKPKPMIEVGGHPILWHIMKIYSQYGFNEFVIALGYKGEIIKDFFINYRFSASNLTVNLNSGEIVVRGGNYENWLLHLLDTGANTMTGGRVKQIAEFVGNSPFMLTYGDGVADININHLLQFYNSKRKIAAVTAVHPPARFGELNLNSETVRSFEEKPQTGQGWINGGFFVLGPEVKNYIENDDTIFEKEPLEAIANEQQLVAYRHDGFWQCMDTLRDVRYLDNLWQTDQAPWKVW
ncbi:MAG: glucose-1-phosphate cytidylyltransferase [Deltaproteobacteria bacterium]|nr:glucose-1-phosphate cytidylyltransferase [Deltaproteobacteria bacterium]